MAAWCAAAPAPRAWDGADGGERPVPGSADAEVPAGAVAAPRSVLLVVVDTLRADHVGPGGYPRATTPVLDALAERSAVFEMAMAHSPRTRTSMGALLTGLLPSTTGLTCQLLEGSCALLPPGARTLAEHLRSAGFATVGVVSNVNVDPAFGFDQGFERYAIVAPSPQGDGDSLGGLDAARRWLRQTTDEVTRLGLAALDELADEERFLLYLHYLDPHSPYEPPREHQAFRAESYRTGERAALLISRYDGEIRSVDAGLGRVLARLEELGRADDTMVVVTSDHGEEFNDHGGWNHGRTLYDEVLRVPLVVAVPGRTDDGRRVGAQVGLVDVLPTVLATLGLDVPAGLPGRALDRALDGAPLEDGAAVAEAGTRPLASLRRPPWKLILDLESGATELFHIARDPHERHELSRDHPEVVARLRAELKRALADARRAGEGIPRDPDAGPTIGPGTRELMEALGYVEDS